MNDQIDLVSRAKGFNFYLWEMQLALRQYISTSAGFRCVAASLKIFSCYFELNSMSYTTIRRWLLYYGYYLLLREHPKRDRDWVFINDFSIQLGQEKCFLILGASLQQMRETGFNLTHKNVRVLDIVVTSRSNSKLVKERLELVSSRVGEPVQIVGDGGSDIKKGNNLFCQNHPGVVYTYDISHKIGCLLKSLLEDDYLWQSLLYDINLTLKKVQQTELSFLRPILPRKKSRYLNVSILIHWMVNILAYQDKKDFSLIGNGFMIHPESIYRITDSINDEQMVISLLEMLDQLFVNKNDIIDKLSLILGERIKEKQIMMIDLSEQRFIEKFGLFEQYREFIIDLTCAVAIIEKVQKSVKNDGLSMETIDSIKLEIKVKDLKGEKTVKIYSQIMTYLYEELSKLGDPSGAYLASSDVEESIFGKYKYKLAERMGGIYETIFILPVFCSNLNLQEIKLACEKYNMNTIRNAFLEMTGQSIQSKRRIAFGNGYLSD